jgi:hypothetical protein
MGMTTTSVTLPVHRPFAQFFLQAAGAAGFQRLGCTADVHPSSGKVHDQFCVSSCLVLECIRRISLDSLSISSVTGPHTFVGVLVGQNVGLEL